MFGILNIDKPPGPSSRDVVNQIQRLVRTRKVGHAGTLDPLASGVLVVCIGPATRLVPYIQVQPKKYRGTFLLGKSSNTEDIHGIITEEASAQRPTREQIEDVLDSFTGQILQRPPDHSALKVNGVRSYKLAREGNPARHEPRAVTIHALRLHSYDYPSLTIDVTCGSGTYIRSLGRDIAITSGTSAVMSALRRTAIGHYHVDRALECDSLSTESIGDGLLSPITAVTNHPEIELSDFQIGELVHGRALPRAEGLAGEYAGVDSQGRLIAILRASTNANFDIVRNFAPAQVDRTN